MPDEQTPPDGMTVKDSPWSVTETVLRLTAAIAAKNLKEFALVDHSGEAEANGLQLRDTKVVIFGSPIAGTPVMQAAPFAALDLPLKVLIYDDGGQTKLCYTAPEALARRYGLPDELTARLAGINAITDAALDR
jgi:uncharacterized protein (DUF302 family)